MKKTIHALTAVAIATTIGFALTAAPLEAKPADEKLQVAKNEIPDPNKAGQMAGAEAAKKPAANIKGFRSARFGMSEAEVRKAIKKDFKLGKKAIKSEENKQERTQILAVDVDDLLPGGGTAKVSYVFGYKTKKLIQVSAVWSAASDEKLTAQQLFSNANVLQNYFGEQGFEPKSIAMNLPTNGGLIMFRGSDANKRTALLMLQGKYRESDDKQRLLTPSALMLFYVEDAEHPDIYRLPKGLF